MAAIGATADGGSRRLALTDDDARGRRLLTEWAVAEGLEPTTDRAGNLFLRQSVRSASRHPVLLGSHLDTQPNGGRFDGVYGVLAALEIVRTLNEHGVRTAAPVDIVVWANEEGGRFPRFCTGSGVYAGVIPLDEARAMWAFDGPTFGEELDRLGWAGEERPGSVPASAYLEAHIEQGALLEQRELQVGIVEGIRGIRHLTVRILGRTAHAGSSMKGRADALRAAGALIVGVADAADEVGRWDGFSVTAGRIVVEPNAQSVVPGYAEVTFDVRASALSDPAPMVAMIQDVAERVSLSRSVACTVDAGGLSYGPVIFDPEVVGALAGAADDLGIPSMRMVSSAGHDAGYVARVTPTAMVFVPCRDGVSHHPSESAKPADLAAGAQVLLRAAVALARR